MQNIHFTKQERDIILWLRFLAAAFLVVGVVFAVNPNYFLQYLDSVGVVFFNFTNLPLENPKHEIWWVLSLGLIGSLSFACFEAQFDWLRFNVLVPVIIVAKLISFLGFLVLTLFYFTHFFYIVACIADGVICLTTWYAYATAIHSRTY